MKLNDEILDMISNYVDIIYSYSPVGSGLQMVLEGGNIDDDSINWCLDNTIPQIEDADLRITCRLCATLLLTLRQEDREYLLRG